MSTEIDVQSLELLRSLRGASIDWVAGVRYPGVSGYSEVRLGVAPGATVSLTLRIADVDDELEVCVPVVQRARPFDSGAKVDFFEVGEFRLLSVYMLQRRESIDSIDSTAETPESYQGANPRAQVLSEIDDGDSSSAHVVDAGVSFAGENGLLLELYADSFPLVFQLTLAIGSSAVPHPKRVKLW